MNRNDDTQVFDYNEPIDETRVLYDGNSFYDSAQQPGAQAQQFQPVDTIQYPPEPKTKRSFMSTHPVVTGVLVASVVQLAFFGLYSCSHSDPDPQPVIIQEQVQPAPAPGPTADEPDKDQQNSLQQDNSASGNNDTSKDKGPETQQSTEPKEWHMEEVPEVSPTPDALERAGEKARELKERAQDYVNSGEAQKDLESARQKAQDALDSFRRGYENGN